MDTVCDVYKNGKVQHYVTLKIENYQWCDNNEMLKRVTTNAFTHLDSMTKEKAEIYTFTCEEIIHILPDVYKMLGYILVRNNLYFLPTSQPINQDKYKNIGGNNKPYLYGTD